MHPILFTIGGYEVPSYGVALALAFAIGIWVAQRRAPAHGIDAEHILDAGMVILVASIVGARAMWVVTHPQYFRAPYGSWTDSINPFGSGGFGIVGLSMLGGVVLAVVAVLAFMAWRRIPVLRVADVLAPSVALGEGITRIGCFLNGCCHGIACDYPWAVTFPAGSGAHALFDGAAVHPTQLYSSFGGFAVFAALSWVLRHKPFDGAVFCAFLVLVALQRVLIDLFRYYEEEVILFRLGDTPFTINQAMALGMIACGLAGFAWHLLRSPRGTGDAATT